MLLRTAFLLPENMVDNYHLETEGYSPRHEANNFERFYIATFIFTGNLSYSYKDTKTPRSGGAGAVAKDKILFKRINH